MTTPDVNVYNYMTGVVVGLLEGNIATLQTHTDALDALTDTNQDLTQSWTSNIDPTLKAALDKVQNNGDMANFIQTYLNATYLPQFSQQFGIMVMTKLSSSSVWDSGAGPSQMNVIQQFLSLIQSASQNDESTGQNESKTESSVLQQDAGTQQPIADMGSTVNGIAGNTASLLQQTF